MVFKMPVGKYRRVGIDEEVDRVIKETCEGIQQRYEIRFLEVGTDKGHVHFLIQSVPTYSPKKIIQIVKSIIAREVFAKCPQVKKKLWGGELNYKTIYKNVVETKQYSIGQTTSAT